MRQIKNIPISDKTDAKLQQGESLLKYWIVAFVSIAILTRPATHTNSTSVIQPVSYVTPSDPVCGGETWCFLGWRI